MYIYERQFTLKPGLEPDEMLQLLKEAGSRVYSGIPGLKSVSIFKYAPAGGNPLKGDYAVVEVWESEEAHRKGKTYEKWMDTEPDAVQKLLAMEQEYSDAFATLVASIK